MKKIMLFVMLISFFNFSPVFAQSKTIEKLKKKYFVGNVKDEVFTVRSKSNKRYGLANHKGEIILKPTFTWISRQNNLNGSFIASNDQLKMRNDHGGSDNIGYKNLKILNSKGKSVPKPQLNGLELILRGGGKYNNIEIYLVRNANNQVGFIDGEGNLIIACAYTHIAAPNENGKGYIFKADKYGIYDLSSKQPIELNFVAPYNKISYDDIYTYFKAKRNQILNWKITNNEIIVSKNGKNFGVFDVANQTEIVPENYHYNIQKSYSKECKLTTYKLKKDDNVMLFDKDSKEIFLKIAGVDDIEDIHKCTTKKLIKVSDASRWDNFYNLKTKENILESFKLHVKSYEAEDDFIIYGEGRTEKLYSISQKKLLDTTTYRQITTLRQERARRKSAPTRTKNEYLVGNINGKFGLIKSNGKHVTKFIYSSIHQGILSKDKKEVLNDFIVLRQAVHNKKGGYKNYFKIIDAKTGELMIENANKIMYQNNLIIKMEYDNSPNKTDEKYYTSYTTDGKQLSETRGYNYEK